MSKRQYLTLKLNEETGFIQQLFIKYNYYVSTIHMENSAVVIGLEKVSFHSNPKERQCQRLLKLPHNFTQLTHQQNNAQNSPSQASAVCGPQTFRCSSWILNQRSNCQHPLDHQKSKRAPEKHLLWLY